MSPILGCQAICYCFQVHIYFDFWQLLIHKMAHQIHCPELWPFRELFLVTVFQAQSQDCNAAVIILNLLSHTMSPPHKPAVAFSLLYQLVIRVAHREFPGSPVVRALHFHCREHRFNPWSGNSDPKCYTVWGKQKDEASILYFSPWLCTFDVL